MQCKSKFFKYEITVVLAQHDGYSNSFHKNTMSGDLKFFLMNEAGIQNDFSAQRGLCSTMTEVFRKIIT